MDCPQMDWAHWDGLRESLGHVSEVVGYQKNEDTTLPETNIDPGNSNHPVSGASC